MASPLVVSNVNGRGVLKISDVRPLMQVLASIDKGHVVALRAEGREIAKPVESAIKQGIPATSPISGFVPKVIPGRLTWNTGVSAQATKIDTPRLKVRAKFNSIVRVKALSPALTLGDMAGRSKRFVARYPYTREYPYSRSATGMRKHRITHEGSLKFISNMDRASSVKQRHASRFVWPSAEKALPAAREKFVGVLQRYYDQVNTRLRS